MRFAWFMVGANTAALLMNVRDGHWASAGFSAVALVIFGLMVIDVRVMLRGVAHD